MSDAAKSLRHGTLKEFVLHVSIGKSKNQGGNIILRPKGGNITLRPKCFGINVKNQGNVRLIILFKSRKKYLFFSPGTIQVISVI